jgi:outer membrane murein-binding lipoprotein Lpp
MKRFSVLFLSASLTTALLLSGCASDQMKQDIADAKSMAEQAQASADRAQQSADAAAAKADSATARADAAASAADAAQSCCNDNRERIDRMFRKSMYK